MTYLWFFRLSYVISYCSYCHPLYYKVMTKNYKKQNDIASLAC